MNIFILDKNLKIIDKFSSEGDIQNVSPFFNDIYKQYLETGAETFKFTCTKNNNIEYGNYIAFMFDNKYKLFQISDIDETHEQNFEVEIYCEFAGIELTNEPLRARTIPSANIKQYLDTVLADVDWEVGYVDEDIADIYTIDIKKATKIYIHIQETIKKYDCEIEFRVEFKGNRVVGKYIDAYKRRGIETNVRIEYGKVADKVSRRTTGKPLSTALIGYGKDNIDFKNVEWSKSKGDPCDKPLGQDWIGDETAYKKYNRNGNHIIGIFDADTESPMELLRLTYRELQNVKEPQVDYGCNVAILDYSKIRLGDTVYVIDNEFGSDVLHLSARVNELEISFTDETKNKIEFSNYKKVKSKITPEMRNILNQIPSNTEFMGISKGGLLSSDIEADGFNIKIKNRLVNKDGKEYYVRLKDKAYTGFMNDILPHDPRYITQSFAMDFEEGCIYTSQVVTETNPEHILISKIRMSDKKVLGYMRLHGFGHGSQIGIDKLDGVTKIWCECYGEPHITTGKLFGTKICRFTFENGKEYTTSAGNVFDMVTDARNIQVSVSEQTNRLSVKYITYSNKNAIKVYDLKSVIDNDPRMLASFTIPSWLETSISPNQGHSVYGNRIYHYQGGDSSVNESKARVTVFDFMGNVLDSNIILDDINFNLKEPEGLFVRENNGVYELYAGMSEGAWPNRKYHIYKFMDSLDDDFEKRGSFIHNNGYKSNIEEVIINTCFNGSDRRKAYLLFTDKVSNKFVVASFKSGKWWIGTEEYTPRINDAIVAELAETNDRVDVSLLTNDFESIKGADGQNGFSGADAKYVLLTGEQIFKYTNNFTGTPTPSSITLTGTPFNISSSNAKWYYKKSSDTNYTLISANNGKMEFTLNHNDSTLFANNNKVVTIKFDIDGYYDEMTIAKISDGSSGSDGEDGYFVLLTNENHTVPCENDGTVVNGELEKAKTEIHVFKGTQEVSFSLSKTDVGCTSTYDSSTKTLSITSLTSKTATVTMQITVNGTVFTKVMTVSKATKGDTGEDSYTVDMTNDNYSFNCDAKGNIASVITTTTVITAFKGVNPVVPTIGTLPTVAGLTLSKSNGIITIKANTGTSLADNGSFDIPVTVGGNNFIKTFSWTKVKNGSNGSDGISVTSTDVEYAQNTSATTAPTTGWTTTAPTWTNGKYIWSRTKTVLSSGTTKYTNPACITGQQGNSGATGTGISSITEEYYLSTSKTTQTGGSWVATPPTWSTGKYMWTRSKIVYNNPTSTVYTTPICDSSWEAVNDMEIGVRNLLKGSNKAYTNINISQWNGTVSRWGRKHCSEFGLQAGDTITFSVKIRPINKSKLRARIDFYSESSGEVGKTTYANSEIIFKGEEKVSSVTATIPKDKEYITLYIQNADTVNDTTVTSEQYMHDILTKGNKVVGWTPAPEDVDNAIGNNLKTVDVMYYLSTSQTSLTGGSWQTTAPTWVNGKYMWSKTVTTLANGTTKESSPTCIAGAKGDTGSAGKGVKSIVEQYYLSTSQTSLSGGSWSTTVPTWQQGKYIWTRSVITYTDNTTTTTNGICVSGSKGDKGDAGTNGTNGVNGTSPVLVTITGQQSMKYLDKTTAPTPSTITLTANVMEGNVVVSSGITYIWQYKNSSGTWVNLSGTYTSKTYSLAHNNTGFVNEVAQIRVAVSYKSKTYYLEHTVTKIYDNKYISKQEVFDKITEGGTNQLIYKDPSTGEIYINATFIKTGQLVADLIKGGILTLGGTGNSDTGDYGRFRILDSTGQNELASMDGGEMRMVNLQAEELNATDLNVKNINCATYAPAIYEYTKVYVNTTSGNDDVEFESGAIFKTLQGALDSAPKNLNGFTTEIVLQTAVSENIVIRGFSGGTLNILMNSKNINGYVVARDCSAQVFILGGLTTTDIPDGINNTGLRPNIQPSQLFSFGGYNYSFVAIGCPFVYVRSVDIFGKTGTTTNYCGGSVNGSNVYVQNVNAYASNSGWNVTTGGKMTTKETYGRCERLAYNVQLGGVAHICNGNSTGAPSNIYTGNGGQVIQGNVTFVGSGDVGSNNNTTTNNTSIVLNANYGDSYKVKYSSWRKDNSVRQGDWSSTGMNKGCWFFGNQFADLKGKTIKSVKLTLQRQSGGNSGAVAFTLKMHNHTGRPSGAPSYLSGWSKNVSLSVGQSTTITITDSAVLTAIKNGTMKGFGIEVTNTSNSYYGILTPKLKAVVTY